MQHLWSLPFYRRNYVCRKTRCTGSFPTGCQAITWEIWSLVIFISCTLRLATTKYHDLGSPNPFHFLQSLTPGINMAPLNWQASNFHTLLSFNQTTFSYLIRHWSHRKKTHLLPRNHWMAWQGLSPARAGPENDMQMKQCIPLTSSKSREKAVGDLSSFNYC